MTLLSDDFFLRMAILVAQRSKCLNRQIGGVLVRDQRIIATGYNGPPTGIPHCSTRPATHEEYAARLGDVEWTGTVCPRRVIGQGHGEGREWCPAIHAEANIIINAARMGVATAGATIYLSCGTPCKNCLGVLINAGIAEVVVTSFDVHDDLSNWLLKRSSLRLRTYDTWKIESSPIG